MRILLSVLALVMAACGGSGGSSYGGYSIGCVSDGPKASNMVLDPTMAFVGEGNGSVTVSVTLDYKAKDAKISFIEFRVEDPAGTRVDAGIIEQGLKKSGSYGFDIAISTQVAERYTVRVRLNDVCGERSKWQEAPFTVEAVAALSGKTGFATARLNAVVYVVGGRDADGVLSGALLRYDPASGAVGALAPMPEGRDLAAAATWNGRIYVFGGSAFGFGQASTFVYDTSGDTWTAVSPMTIGTAGARAVPRGDLIVVSSANRVDTYDPVLDLWYADTR